ncbi:cation:proton antiporter [Halorubrum gandharaense]
MYETLFALTTIFAVAAALLLVAARFDLPVIPFYLLAGALSGVVIDEARLFDLAQWGIAFIVFLFGVHVDLESVAARERAGVGVAVVQAVLIGSLGYLVATVIGLGPLNAVYFAVAAGLSSSLVAASYLDQRDGIRPTHRRLSEAIHFTEDLLGVAVVVALGAFVYADIAAPVQILIGAGILLGGLLVRYLLFHRLTALVRDDPEVLMMLGFSLVIGFIALAEAAGLSIVVGAFAAGVAVADDYPHSLALVDTLHDLRDFFAPVFFVTVGALLTVPTVATVGYTAALLFGVLFVNPLIVTLLALRVGYDGRTAVYTAAALDHVSAFSLFIAIEAIDAGLIARPLFDAIVWTAGISMVVSAYGVARAPRIHRLLRRSGLVDIVGTVPNGHTSVPDDLSNHVIVVDHRHGGDTVLSACADSDRGLVVVEDDPTVIDAVTERCDGYVYGDLLDDRVWERANLADAGLLVSLAPEADRAEVVAELDTDVPRVVRADDEALADRLLDAGVETVVAPETLAADRLTRNLDAVLAGDLPPDGLGNVDRGPTGSDGG